MKNLLLIVLVLVSFFQVAQAASGENGMIAKKGYLVRDNQIMELKRGKLSPLKKEVKLNNGYTLHTNGSLTSETGIRRNLREGEGINKDGHIMFGGRENGRIVLVDTPVGFFSYENIYGAKKVKTVTGIAHKDVKMPATTVNTTVQSDLH